GILPATTSTAQRSSASYSASSSAAASPVEPATTSAWVPACSWDSRKRRKASRSTSPLASNGVASAVMLPEGRKGEGLVSGAFGCYLRPESSGKYAGSEPPPAQGRRVRLHGAGPARPPLPHRRCLERPHPTPDHQREPPAHQCVHHASAVPTAAGDPPRGRQRVQHARRKAVHGGARHHPDR